MHEDPNRIGFPLLHRLRQINYSSLLFLAFKAKKKNGIHFTIVQDNSVIGMLLKTNAVFTFKLKRVQGKHVSTTKHVSSKHVCYCIEHIRFKFQTRFNPGCLIYSV